MKTITQLSVSLLALSLAFTASADTITVESDLDVKGVLSIGNSEKSNQQPLAGMIRWTGTAFECYDGVSWKKLPISIFADDGIAQWGSDTNSVSSAYSTVWGYKNTVSGTNATAWGKKNKAQGDFSTVWGFSSTASGKFSTAWGRYVNAPSLMSTALGKFNIGSFNFSDDDDDTNDGNTVWFGFDPLLEVGIGDNNQNRANALTLLKDGRLALGRHTTLSALQTQPETVQLQGALKIGDYSKDPEENASEGAIRFSDDGSGSKDLLGYVGGTWRSLTQSEGNSAGTVQTLSIDGDQLTISGIGGNTVTLPAGSNGANGANGQDGATWLTGAGVPDDASGNEGDLYLNTSNGDYYVKISGAWGNKVNNLNGPKGDKGDDGAIGPQGAPGASPFVLNDNDVYYMGGNVGIGVTEPSEALDVSGDIRVNGAVVLTSHSGDIPSITY